MPPATAGSMGAPVARRKYGLETVADSQTEGVGAGVARTQAGIGNVLIMHLQVPVRFKLVANTEGADEIEVGAVGSELIVVKQGRNRRFTKPTPILIFYLVDAGTQTDTTPKDGISVVPIVVENTSEAVIIAIVILLIHKQGHKPETQGNPAGGRYFIFHNTVHAPVTGTILAALVDPEIRVQLKPPFPLIEVQIGTCGPTENNQDARTK